MVYIHHWAHFVGGFAIIYMENLDQYIKDMVAAIKTVNTERKYWLVRTMGGAYYGEFIRNKFIAIGFNEILLRECLSLPENIDEAKEGLKNLLEQRRLDLKQTGYYAAQILHFVRDVKEGDIVVIPSVNGSHVAIGIVQGDIYEDAHVVNAEGLCPFQKRRRVLWKSYSRKIKLPPSLQLVFSSHHAVSNIDSYAPYIDSAIGDCYMKNDMMNLVIRVRTLEDVNMTDFMAIDNIRKMANDICVKMGYPNEEPITIKIQMESPGIVKLATLSVIGLTVFGLVVIALCGGGIKYESANGDKLELYTDGAAGAVNEYLDKEADRGMVKEATDAVHRMNIDSIKDLEPVIELLRIKNEAREKY